MSKSLAVYFTCGPSSNDKAVSPLLVDGAIWNIRFQKFRCWQLSIALAYLIGQLSGNLVFRTLLRVSLSEFILHPFLHSLHRRTAFLRDVAGALIDVFPICFQIGWR